MAFICKFNSVESIFLETCKMLSLLRQVVFIYRWSLEQVWLYMPPVVYVSKIYRSIHESGFITVTTLITVALSIVTHGNHGNHCPFHSCLWSINTIKFGIRTRHPIGFTFMWCNECIKKLVTVLQIKWLLQHSNNLKLQYIDVLSFMRYFRFSVPPFILLG